jgi:kinetochore protein NDC80
MASGGASVSSGNNDNSHAPPRRRIPKSRQSMAPNIGSSSNSSFVNRENNGRVSGIAAPSPSRRTSMAGQRPSSAGGRKSLGGAILQSGHHGATPSKNRRVSIAPSSSMNSGNGNGNSQNHPNVDPRDVKDKSYLLGAIKKMVSYLKSRGYDATALNIKQLVNGPSGRDFNNIMTFLLRRIDPTFNTPIPPGQKNNGDLIIKFEDEVSMAFKCLGYPFPISKTGLVAVGSPHTWPALIAAIDWLVDVLMVAEEESKFDWEMEENPQEEELLLQTFQGMNQRSEKQWHQFLRRCMVSFLNNDQEECDELEGDLLEAFHRDNEKVEAYLNRMIEENEGTKMEIERLNAEVNK